MIRLALLLLILAPAAWAAPLSREEVPSALTPWVRWALDGREAALCPFLQGSADEKRCAWPGVLQLRLSERGGSFEQSFRVYAEDWAALPGEPGRWPQDVRVDGAAATVVSRNGLPAVRLKPGLRRVAGTLRWDAPPEVLRVAPETGLVALESMGRSVPFPVRDGQGRLWLQRAQTAAAQESHLEVSVHRRLVDDAPLTLVTRVQLKVSGKNREAVLGRSLPEGFVPVSVSGALPARVEPDGKLRAQVRAGTWDLELLARREGRDDEVKLPEPGGPWDPDEVWAFEARPRLRVATVEGAPGIDPQQTQLPHEWRRFPTFLLKAPASLRLVERRRGQQTPDPDRLTLSRTLWLDFDGRGVTAQDSIHGTLGRSWRLEMGPETRLGRAAVGGQDQFLTALKAGGPAGVEVRDGQVDLAADSRIERRPFSLPAVSWNHDFEQVSAELRLPPGWRLVHVFGVDRADPTWVRAWTLLDLFLVLVIAVAVARLWGRRWGWAAAAAAGLAWHEPGAPRGILVALVALEALARAFPEGSVRSWVLRARLGARVLLALIAVAFAIGQLRTGMYPQLAARGGVARGGLGGVAFGKMAMVSGAAAPAAAPVEQEEVADAPEGYASQAASELGESLRYSRRDRAERKANAFQRNVMLLDPKSEVSTGPGLPDWTWTSARLGWSGPVDSGQRIRLLLLPPGAELLLALARVALLAAIGLLMFGLPVAGWLRSARDRAAWGRALRWLFPAVLLLLAAPARAQVAGSFPPAQLLEDLAKRLLEPAECAPACAEISKAVLEVEPSSLRIRLDIHAAADTAVPLPGAGEDWLPARALLDGSPAGVRRDEQGTLWLAVTRGARQAVLEGPLPDRDTVQLGLPLKPRRVEAAVSGWTLDGLLEDGVPQDSLQLARRRASASDGRWKQGSYPPFVSVERTLRLGLAWEVETRVRRQSPLGAAISLEVPLLPGESVMSADVRAQNGLARVTLGPKAEAAVWTSALGEDAVLTLTAPERKPWFEAWRVEAGPIWHVEAAGIPGVQQEAAAGPRAREWRPWPGEAVRLAVTRPQGVPGQTLTIDQASLVVSPGRRAADATLSLRLRSSRGGPHPIELPEGADLRSVKMDGALQPIRAEGRRVILDVQPGTHEAELVWREPRGMRLLFKTSRPDLGAPAVNASIHLSMPADRWTLLLGGPPLGPAVLFWSALAVFLLASAGLAKLGLTPLDWRQWFLLFVGLTQVPVPLAAIVAGWLLVLGLRGKHSPAGAREFDVAQLFLAGWTLVAVLCLSQSISRGLLGMPDMQISGNGSYASSLAWYQDRSGRSFPGAWALSAPLWLYRAAMLAWALWLASSTVRWARWGWECFSTGGLWKPLRAPKAPAPPETPGAA
ncbi:MAG: hypothetical protein HY554_04185 [Elusimicrobia bacterium]|nr:hypothetical protein [Elusimicrobiota bacterium]